MADDTPDAPAPTETPPAPRRRGRPASARPENGTKPESAAKPPRKPRTVKATVVAAEEAVVEAAKKPAAAVAGAARSAVKAVKPRAAKRATPPTASKGKAKKSGAKAGKGWGKAAIAGGVIASSALAAVFALRSSTPKPKPAAPTPPTGKAHQPDGTDSSKSFAAGIADESSIPDTTPTKS